jgi:hypothetical protein
MNMRNHRLKEGVVSFPAEAVDAEDPLFIFIYFWQYG